MLEEEEINEQRGAYPHLIAISMTYYPVTCSEHSYHSYNDIYTRTNILEAISTNTITMDKVIHSCKQTSLTSPLKRCPCYDPHFQPYDHIVVVHNLYVMQGNGLLQIQATPIMRDRRRTQSLTSTRISGGRTSLLPSRRS